MEHLDVDIVSLFAYADKGFERDRELWRGFLALVLPLLLEVDNKVLERTIDQAMVNTPEQCTLPISDETLPEAVVRWISAALAREIGAPPELGLAAFLDANLPTRTMMLNQSRVIHGESKLVRGWLGEFTRRREQDEFQERVVLWRQLLENAMIREEELEESSDHSVAS